MLFHPLAEIFCRKWPGKPCQDVGVWVRPICPLLKTTQLPTSLCFRYACGVLGGGGGSTKKYVEFKRRRPNLDVVISQL
jgi:hypothetical protein